MPSVTPILWTHKTNRKGLSPIYIRVQAGGKTRYASLRTYVRESEWNPNQGRVRKGHKHSERINATIADRVAEAEAEILKLRHQREEVSAVKLKRHVKKDIKQADPTDFHSFADQIADQFERQGKIYSAKRYRSICGKVEALTGRPLPFSEITPAFLREYETHLVEKYKNKVNTVASNMRCIRAVVYRAIKDGLMEQGRNPFFKYQIKREKPSRDRLSLEQVKAIEKLDLEKDSLIWHVRNYWLFSFYCAGIRFADVATMRCKHVEDGRLRYTMRKTGGKKDLKLLPPAVAIVKRYESDDPEAYLFPMLRGYNVSTTKKLLNAIASQNALVNSYLKKIAARAEIKLSLSFHVSRHSFADSARDRGMDLYSISKALGHSDLKVTEAYLAGFDAESQDDSMEAWYNGD